MGSSSCECSPTSIDTIDLSSGFEESFVPKIVPTIDSGDLRELTLWRVASFSKEWVDNEPGAPEPAGTTVSTRRVLKEVEGMLADKPWMITIQQQP